MNSRSMNRLAGSICTPTTTLLVLRGLNALLEKDSEEDTEATHPALREWLPPPEELLRIAEVECLWRATSMGTNHPSLLCARLHGERLGKWDVAAEVAEGVLAIERFNPLLRIHTHLLLAAAHAALGRRTVACEAAELAVAEPVGALHELLRWCEVGEVEGVQTRVDVVMGRVAASAEELVGVFDL